MSSLAIKRPIFHSEADFQFALAWEIQIQYPVSEIRLEYPLIIEEKKRSLDILVKVDNITYFIELKYKSKGLSYNINGEKFELKDQGAQDIGRYDFVKDVYRVEEFSKPNQLSKGISIFLSNDTNYWKKSNRRNTVDKDFRIHEGKILKNKLLWTSKAGKGTTKGREEIINLSGVYSCHWKHYSIGTKNNSEFKFLLIHT